MASVDISGTDPRGGAYTFDVQANADALNGNNAIYTTSGFGGSVSGSLAFNPDLSSQTVSPQVLISGLASIPPLTWVFIAAIVFGAFYLGKKQ